MDYAHNFTPWLVVLSVVIATLASYTALDIAGRVYSSAGRVKAFWIVGGAIAMGTGIWSMHFIGMLAMQLPVTVTYDPAGVFVSVLVAIGASAGGPPALATVPAGLACRRPSVLVVQHLYADIVGGPASWMAGVSPPPA